MSLQHAILPGEILAVQVGLWRTAVMVRTGSSIRCGLAASLTNQDPNDKTRYDVKDAGRLHKKDYRELAALIDSSSLTEASIGLATINALLPPAFLDHQELNAYDFLQDRGRDKKIALIGHFPFFEQVRKIARNLWVFELNPQEGDLPAEAAPDYLPQADLVALTATTLVNHTFENLVSLCRKDASIVMIGPSTPLTSLLFNHGVSVLSGTIVLQPESTVLGVAQGGSMHRMHDQGFVKFVTVEKSEIGRRATS